VAISAIDTVSLAFRHTKQQLLQPFRFGQWVRLAIVGLLAGELGSGGSNLRSSLGKGSGPLPPGFPHIDPAILGAIIALLIVIGLVFFLVMTYISSVMRFILFDSVLSKYCRIGEGWSRRQGPGFKLFLWHLGFGLIVLCGVVVLVGLPVAFAYFNGWFSAPRAHMQGLILGGLAVFCAGMLLVVTVVVIHVFTKDFVVPQMALEGIGPIEAWSRLWPMLQAEKGDYAVYAIVKVVLAIVAAIIVGIATAIIGVIVALPAIGMMLAAVVAGKTAGLTWNVFTITGAVVAGCILLGIFLFLVAMISVPVMVFFPAYSIYFFAPRYRALGLALYPAPPQTVTSTAPQGFTPPPAPLPAG